MPRTDAQRRANAKWDKENTMTAACKLRKDEHAAFKAYAEQHGKTISGMLLEYIRGCITDMEQNETTEQPPKNL